MLTTTKNKIWKKKVAAAAAAEGQLSRGSYSITICRSDK